MFRMLDRRRVLVFVMDPIESVDIDADTTFVLMLEAQRRGHERGSRGPVGEGGAGGGGGRPGQAATEARGSL